MLAVASVAAIVVGSRDVPGHAPASAEPSPQPIVPLASPPPAPVRRLDVDAVRRELKPAQPAPLEPPGPPPPRPPAGSWEAVEVAARPAALGAPGAALGRELNELQPKLSACFDEDMQARHGLQAYTAVKDAAPMDDRGATVLVLQVEELDGELRIVDAPVETRGGASDGLISCAQRVLRGHAVPADDARAGARHRVLFTLLQ